MKKYTFWVKTGIAFQMITTIFHSLSLVNEAQPANETETQLLGLMKSYKFDLGLGFFKSMNDLMTSFSISFSLLLLFSICINWFLLKKNVEINIWKGIILINLIIFSLCFLTMTVFTFLPPIICTGLIVISFLIALILIKPKTSTDLI
jgi:hypothetical protein